MDEDMQYGRRRYIEVYEIITFLTFLSALPDSSCFTTGEESDQVLPAFFPAEGGGE